MERVVITGMGAITPLGNNVEQYWNGLITGKNGIGPITKFDAADYKQKVAGEVRDFAPEDYGIDKKEARHMSMCCQYALAAANEAMAQAKLTKGTFDPFRAGVLFGSGVGGIEVMEEEITKLNARGARRVSPFCIPMMIGNMVAAYISIEHDLKGESYDPVSACASSSQAIGAAMRAIRHGYMDICVAGGSEASITKIAVAGFGNMKALTDEEDPELACRPFDKNRNGFVIGEGAGALVLESLSHAQARGATILAEVCGYGSTSDAYHITSPDPTGIVPSSAMKQCLADAGMKPEDVSYINAHGTSTPMNDKCESAAIRLAFGDAADAVKISSTKSMTGHLLGGAGAIEAIACVQAVRENIVPPTIHYREPDEECTLDYTPNEAVSMPVYAAMSNSLGFGGHNACVLVRKFEA